MNTETKKSAIAYLGGMAFLGVLLVVVYAAKGIVPFGTGTVDYFDGTQVGLPNLYQFWDILHGRVSLFYDPYEGLGTAILPCYLPDYLLLWFFPRLYVRVFPALVIGLRLLGSCVVMQFVLSRMAPGLSLWLRAGLGVLYACCGFTLSFNCLLIWLDFVMLFPLVLLGLDDLFREGRRFWLAASLALLFALNVYMAAFVLLFVLLYGGLEVFLKTPAGEQGKQAWRLALSTAQGILLPAAAMLPVAIIELGSDRAGLVGGTAWDFVKGYLTGCVTAANTGLATKANMLFGLWAPALWLVIRLAKKARRGDQNALAGLLCLTGLLLPIVNESVNLSWHFGSYHLFPMRYGYMLAALVVVLFARECRTAGWEEPVRRGWIAGLWILLPALSACASLAWKVSEYGAEQAAGDLRFKFLVADTLLFFGLALLARGLGKKPALAAAALVLAAHTLFALYAYVAPANRVGDYAQQPQFVADSALLNEQMDSASDPLQRVKNGDTSLNNNYPLVLGRPALSGWTDGVWTDTMNGDFRRCFIGLGYANSFTRILDQGGTLFSDAFIGVRQQLVSYETALETANYTLVRELGGYHLYDCAFTLPAGLTVDAEAALALEIGEDIAGNQNALWHLLSGRKDDLLTEQRPGWLLTDEGRACVTLELASDVELYLHYQAPRGVQVNVYLNDELVTVPYYQRPYNKAYPDDFCNGLLDLGAFDGEEVTLALEPRDGAVLTSEDLEAVALLTLDRAALAEFCAAAQGADYAAAGRHMTLYTENGIANRLMLLPVQYSEGWSCRLNGQKVEPIRVGGGLLALPMIDGGCSYQMSFLPVGFRLGAALSVLGVLLTLLLILGQKTPLYAALEQRMAVLCRPLLGLAFAAALLLVYLIPLACSAAAFFIT